MSIWGFSNKVSYTFVKIQGCLFTTGSSPHYANILTLFRRRVMIESTARYASNNFYVALNKVSKLQYPPICT